MPKKFDKFLNRTSKVATIATKALTIARGVAALLNVEFKRKDTIITNAVCGQTGQINGLNNLIQGDTDQTRNGDSIRCKSLALNYRIDYNTAGGAVQHIKLVILQRYTPNGSTVPAVLDVFDDADAVSLVNIEKASNWRILWKRDYVLTSQHDAIRGTDYIQLGSKRDGKHMGMVTKFDGNTGTYTDMQKNSLILMAYSGDLTNGPVLNYRCRVRYIDN